MSIDIHKAAKFKGSAPPTVQSRPPHSMDIPAKALVHLLVHSQIDIIRTSMAKTINKLSEIEIRKSAPKD